MRRRHRIHGAVVLGTALLFAGCAEPLGTRGRATLGGARSGNEMERREDEARWEIEAHEREIRRQRVEIEAMRSREYDAPTDDDSYDGERMPDGRDHDHGFDRDDCYDDR